MNPDIDPRLYSNRNVLCIDMKSFYASCQALSMGLDPLTAHLAVVADTNRKGSVVLAASPALKRDFGIRTGNRLFEIPHDHHITVVSAQMNMYLRISKEITRLFNKYVPKEALHTYSVDESFLQVDGMSQLWGSAESIAEMILTELNDTFGLTAAVGIGPNMLMAKLCLDLEAKNMALLAGHMQIFRQNYGQSVLYHRCGALENDLKNGLTEWESPTWGNWLITLYRGWKKLLESWGTNYTIMQMESTYRNWALLFYKDKSAMGKVRFCCVTITTSVI